MRNAYDRGFEDAVELCLAKTCDSKTLEEAREEINKILSKITSAKVWSLEHQTCLVWHDHFWHCDPEEECPAAISEECPVG